MNQTQTTDKATARPWMVCGRTVLPVNEHAPMVCDCRPKSNLPDDGQAAANAALIVTAVNEHAALCTCEQVLIELKVWLMSPDLNPDTLENMQAQVSASLSTLANIRKQNGGGGGV